MNTNETPPPEGLAPATGSGSYEPFGPEWEKHVMKLPKSHLVQMLKKVLVGTTYVHVQGWAEMEPQTQMSFAKMVRLAVDAVERGDFDGPDASAPSVIAAAAPDKQKLIAYANALFAVPVPEMTSEEGREEMIRVRADVIAFCRSIKIRAGEL